MRRRIAPFIAAGAGIGGLALASEAGARVVERMVPRDGGILDVDGAAIHHIDIGDGPPIVFVHGLGGQLRNFTYALTERLAADFRIVALDRPGSGYSTIARGAAPSLRGQAAQIGRFIEAKGIERPLLVGHSLGGALALSLALDRPGLIGGLALVAPLTQPVDGLPPVFRALDQRSAFRRWLIARTLAVPLGWAGQRRTRRAVFAPDPVPPGFVTRGGGALALRPGAFLAASREVGVGTGEIVGMATRYPSLGVPLGILFGRGDAILSPAIHGERTVAAVPGAELTLIEGGHMIPLTAPDAVADWIRHRHATMR